MDEMNEARLRAQAPALSIKRFGYDAAILVAADRSDRRVWAEHKSRLQFGPTPLVPAPVVARLSRSANQAQLRRFLASCLIVPFVEADAPQVGHLLGKAGMADGPPTAPTAPPRQTLTTPRSARISSC